MENFYRQKEAGQGIYSSKNQIVSGKVTFLLGKAGVYQADYLTSTDQVIPEQDLESVIWFKITFLGEAKTAVRLGMKSWFADVGLGTSDSLLGLLFLFF